MIKRSLILLLNLLNLRHWHWTDIWGNSGNISESLPVPLEVRLCHKCLKDPDWALQVFLSALEMSDLWTPGKSWVSNPNNPLCLFFFRFLLHLAEKTDGIIVTNDNLRDFVDTSDTWRRIIQERWLVVICRVQFIRRWRVSLLWKGAGKSSDAAD